MRSPSGTALGSSRGHAPVANRIVGHQPPDRDPAQDRLNGHAPRRSDTGLPASAGRVSLCACARSSTRWLRQTEVDTHGSRAPYLASHPHAEFPGHVCRPTRSDVAIRSCWERSPVRNRGTADTPGLHHSDPGFELRPPALAS